VHKSQSEQLPLALSVETSGREGSIAVGIADQVLGETAFSAPLRHSAELFPAAARLLHDIGRQARQVRHIYVSAGPGSFTGIRIAITFAKAFHFATNAKVVAVNTMDLIADNATDYISAKGVKIDKIATILDAKRRQFFVAVYRNQRSGRRKNKKLQRDSDTKRSENNSCIVPFAEGVEWEKIFPDSLMTADEFVRRFGRKEPIRLLGEGLLYYSDAFKAPAVSILDRQYWLPRARKLYKLGWQMAAIGKFSDPATLVPFYLRNPEITPKRHPPHPTGPPPDAD